MILFCIILSASSHAHPHVRKTLRIVSLLGRSSWLQSGKTNLTIGPWCHWLLAVCFWAKVLWCRRYDSLDVVLIDCNSSSLFTVFRVVRFMPWHHPSWFLLRENVKRSLKGRSADRLYDEGWITFRFRPMCMNAACTVERLISVQSVAQIWQFFLSIFGKTAVCHTRKVTPWGHVCKKNYARVDR